MVVVLVAPLYLTGAKLRGERATYMSRRNRTSEL